jgi:hypothetical protein
MSKTPYQILREELINWISNYTGLIHIDEPLSNEVKEGYFTIIADKGEADSKTAETEFYRILFYMTDEKVMLNYSEVHNSICEVRTNVFDAVSGNYESSQANIIDFDYLGYDCDYEEGILEIAYSFDFERNYY